MWSVEYVCMLHPPYAMYWPVYSSCAMLSSPVYDMIVVIILKLCRYWNDLHFFCHFCLIYYATSLSELFQVALYKANCCAGIFYSKYIHYLIHTYRCCTEVHSATISHKCCSYPHPFWDFLIPWTCWKTFADYCIISTTPPRTHLKHHKNCSKSTVLLEDQIQNSRHQYILQEGEGKAFPVHAMKAFMRSRGIAPLILNLGTRWRWAVSFTPSPQPVSLQGELWYLLNRMGLDGCRVGLDMKT